MSKLFPGSLAVAPAFAASTDWTRTSLKADSIHTSRMTDVCGHDHDLRSRSPQRGLRTHRHHPPGHFDNHLLRGHPAQTYATTPHESCHLDWQCRRKTCAVQSSIAP